MSRMASRSVPGIFDNALRGMIHQPCLVSVRVGVRVNCTCYCWQSTHSKRTKSMELVQSMKLGGGRNGLSIASGVDSFDQFDWLQWLGRLFVCDQISDQLIAGSQHRSFLLPTTSSFGFQEDDYNHFTVATPLSQPLCLARPSQSRRRRFQTDAQNR